MSEESYASPRAVGHSSCAVAFWSLSSDGRMSFDPLHGGIYKFPQSSVSCLPNKIDHWVVECKGTVHVASQDFMGPSKLDSNGGMVY